MRGAVMQHLCVLCISWDWVQAPEGVGDKIRLLDSWNNCAMHSAHQACTCQQPTGMWEAIQERSCMRVDVFRASVLKGKYSASAGLDTYCQYTECGQHQMLITASTIWCMHVEDPIPNTSLNCIGYSTGDDLDDVDDDGDEGEEEGEEEDDVDDDVEGDGEGAAVDAIDAIDAEDSEDDDRDDEGEEEGEEEDGDDQGYEDDGLGGVDDMP